MSILGGYVRWSRHQGEVMDLVSGVDHPESHCLPEMNRKLVWVESEVVGVGDLDHTIDEAGSAGSAKLNSCWLPAHGRVAIAVRRQVREGPRHSAGEQHQTKNRDCEC